MVKEMESSLIARRGHQYIKRAKLAEIAKAVLWRLMTRARTCRIRRWLGRGTLVTGLALVKFLNGVKMFLRTDLVSMVLLALFGMWLVGHEGTRISSVLLFGLARRDGNLRKITR